MNALNLYKNTMGVIFVITGASIVIKNGLMEKIKKNNLYVFDNLYNDLEIVITLEDENIISYNDNFVYNTELDLIEVLIGNKIDVVLTSDLYEIKRIK